MEDTLKNRIIVILAVMTAIFFIGWLSSCVNAGRFQAGRREEISKRLDAEEKLSKLMQDKPALDAKLNKADKNLEDAKVELEATKKNLEQEQLVNTSLKEELQKVTKLKEKLEDDLKDALVAAKQTKSKMR